MADSTPDAVVSAKALRNRYKLTPVPRVDALTSVVNDLGASIGRLAEPGLQGALSPVADCFPGSWEVRIDRTMRSHVLRFAIAHELGHLYLRRGGHSPVQEERWCNAFAAEIVMPEEAVQRVYRDADQTLENVQHFSRRFDVSRSASTIRFNSLMGWQKGLIGLRLVGETWTVARMTCIPTVALYELAPRIDSNDLRKSSRVEESWIRFEFRDELIEVLCQWARRGNWVDLLVSSEDLEHACHEILREQKGKRHQGA